MIEMSSGIGATAMGIGVSHGPGGGEGVAGGCRLRAQSQSQASGSSANTQQSSQQQQQQQQQLQQQQQQPPSSQQQQSQQQQRQGSGIAGRSKKDNCCLCWCCCCSCSNKCLAAVGGNSGGAGGGGDQGKKKGNAGVGNEQWGGVGVHGELGGAGAGNGFDGLDDLDGNGECSLEEIRSWGSSFDKLMRNPAGRKFFREFLVSEYSEENIAFWLACEQLKRESNPEKIEEKARFIYERYISILSPKEVSLDSQVREIVNRNMVQPTPHTFDDAQLQIYTLMHRDSYPRFVNSELYRRVARLSSGSNSEDHGVGKSKGKKGTT